MHNDNEINNDILPLALMFIIAVYLLTILPVQLINKHKAYQELLQAKEIAIYYYDRANSMEDSVTSLNEYISEQDKVLEYQNSLLSEKDRIGRILKDLSQDIPRKTKN